MARLNIFAVCFVSLFLYNFAQCSNKALDSNVEVNFVQNLTDFLQQNPGIKLEPLEKIVKSNDPSTRIQIVHRIGNRIPGDRILAVDSAEKRYNQPQDVRLNLFYPQTGPGNMIITYLEVQVDQSTNLSQAFVIKGGIGQREISIVVESKQTLYFNHKASIFGY
ncbi:uncharacterized protein LOC116344251 [Contarinia nasturtii]|uniref:uncharacterized protein LOC116344251 n=1 Tax=Contarinia nasturtii TaxID=265458 RepID=UPI0012D45044|nr:uncharacterized protein LOC116344251 [Contarinia nasturtii]